MSLVQRSLEQRSLVADDFLAAGRRDVAAARERLARLGMPTHWERVLDFGCGAGRLTQALAEHADEVVGLDASAPTLETARSLDLSGGRCSFALGEDPDLRAFPSGSFDLVVSERALQHLPARVIEGCLAEFVRVLRPGGTALVHCPIRPLWTARGVAWRFVPNALIRWAQRRLLGYPAPMRMTGLPVERVRAVVFAAGGELVDVEPVHEPETHWAAARYVVRRVP